MESKVFGHNPGDCCRVYMIILNILINGNFMHIKKTNNWNGSSYPNPSTYYNTNASANGTVYLYANQILDTSQQITLFM